VKSGTLLATVLSVLTFSTAAADLVVGSEAPGFSLSDQGSTVRSLADYRGRWLVLYFYPKDDTPGCTTEACAFRDDFRQLTQMKVALLGISLDSVDSHRAFADKYSLPFPLLSDPGGEIASRYGALWKLGPIRLARRYTFIIDPAGQVARIYRSVDADEHSQQILDDLAALGLSND